MNEQEREAFEAHPLMAGSLFKRRADRPNDYWDGNVQDDWELWKARAALAAKAVPAGWKLVPVEPTKEMLEAGAAAQVECLFSADESCTVEDARRRMTRAAYRAMLAATPAPAQAQQAEPYTSERHFALREGYGIGASDAYFKAWPTHDNDAGRMLFDRGYVRGFDKATELADARAATKAEATPLTDEQIDALPRSARGTWRDVFRDFARAVEKAHGIGASTGGGNG